MASAILFCFRSFLSYSIHLRKELKENDGKIEEKEKIRVLLYFSKNLFSVNFISRKKQRGQL